MNQVDSGAAMRSRHLDCNNNHSTKSTDSTKLAFGVDSILNRVTDVAGGHTSAIHTLHSLFDLRSMPEWYTTNNSVSESPYPTSPLASLSGRDKASKSMKEFSSQQVSPGSTSESNQALHQSNLPPSSQLGSFYPSSSTVAPTYYGTTNWFYDSALLNQLAIKSEPYSNLSMTTPLNVYESQTMNQIDPSYLNYYRQIFPNYLMNYFSGANLLVGKEAICNSISATPQTNVNSQVPDKKKRTWSRAVFSNIQRRGLERRFDIQKYITKPDRRQLAASLGLTDAQVKVWFQNRRMKWRRSLEYPKYIPSSRNGLPRNEHQNLIHKSKITMSKDSVLKASQSLNQSTLNNKEASTK